MIYCMLLETVAHCGHSDIGVILMFCVQNLNGDEWSISYFAGVLGTVKCSSIDKEGVDDRVYRLHYNDGQNRVDKFAAAGGVLGGVLSLGTLTHNPYIIAGGVAAGSFAGILCHVGTAPKKE